MAKKYPTVKNPFYRPPPPETRRFDGKTYYFYRTLDYELAPSARKHAKAAGYSARIVKDRDGIDWHIYTRPKHEFAERPW